MRPSNAFLNPLVGLSLAALSAAASGAESPAAPSSSAAASPGAAATSAEAAPSTGFADALIGGKPTVALRYRFELFESDDPALPDASAASTFRLALGYETAPYHGVSAMGQFEGVGAAGDGDYRVPNHRTQNKLGRPIIADPEGSEINQAFVKYANPDAMGAMVKLGRQEFVLNNARFISNSGWRQNNMTYDAALVQAAPVAGLGLSYMHILRHNRVTGQDATDGQMEMNSHIFNAAYKLPGIGAAYAFGLMLDYEEAYKGNSSNTFGARVEGPYALTPDIGILFAGEFAKQDKAGDRPTPLDAAYWLVEGGAAWKGLGLKAGYNVRSGNAADGQFNTPLSHPWDGGLELFLNTPVNGLATLSFSLSGPVPGAPGLSVNAAYFMYKAESTGMSYGSEIDLAMEYKVLPVNKNLAVGARYANYMKDEFAADALRWSGYAAYAF